MTSPVFLGSVVPAPKSRALLITPAGAGDRSGVDLANAGRLTDINALILTAKAQGREIHIRADLGPYSQNGPVTLSRGGEAGAPVVIKGTGANGAPMLAEIVGGRANPWIKGDAYGSEVFRFNTGANHLSFGWLHFKNQGNGCFRIRETIAGLTIEDCRGTNVAGFVDDSAPAAGEIAGVNGFTMRRCEVRGYSKRVLRLKYDSSNILVEDVYGDSEEQDGDNFAMGITLDGTAHDIVLRRCELGRHRDSIHGYWNGDSFSTEERINNLLIEDCRAWGNTDSGYDIKSQNVVMRRCIAEDNKRNFRIWGHVVMEDCIGINPFRRGGSGGAGNIGVYTGASYLRVYGGSFTSTGTVVPIEVQQYGTLFVTARSVFIKPETTALASVEADAVCVLNLNEADVTPATISSPLALSLNENLPGTWPLTADEPFAMRIVGGADATVFGKTGRNLTMRPQDFENTGHGPVYHGTLRTFDQNGNTKDHAFNVTIANVADDPIGPAELFAAGTGATAGGWWEVGDLSTVFLEDGVTPVAANVSGQVVGKLLDKSGHGNHIVFDEEDRRPTLQTDGLYYWLHADGRTRGRIGGNGALNFAQLTATVCAWRDEEATQEEAIIAVPRSLIPGTGFNARWSINVIGNLSFGYRLNGASYKTSGSSGAGVRRVNVITMQSAPSLLRCNNVQFRDDVDVPAMSYPVSAPGTLFCHGYEGSHGGHFNGRFYGGVVTNRTEDIDTRFRIERQLAAWGGRTL